MVFTLLSLNCLFLQTALFLFLHSKHIPTFDDDHVASFHVLGWEPVLGQTYIIHTYDVHTIIPVQRGITDIFHPRPHRLINCN
jgi:hypothetical protein